MPVVINEFEVLSEAAPMVRRSDNGDAAAERKAEESPCVTRHELRVLELKLLRVWAH